ncbi:MAG TPA: SbcC/MukB-like Walker B domain-containing protein [Kofleriaceae bacterium]|nr:SbcC/MukB-like Walker B domain-containing protein [Kofleriaceae bacterium]
MSHRIRRVRLVNFHNFVDETVELHAGGHLFLLGDNGSGKTTVLDAVHVVLSGGQALELNAAARIGGRREDGRTLQGVVLRYDVERGVMNEGGAIAYAVLELEDERGGRLCVGVGAEATTMEARVIRWGLVSRRSLEELPLLMPADGGDAPARREALRDSLGRSEVFFQMTEYRAALAQRLFGDERAYDEVCRFWSMAKAYREIVAEAQDFAALFRRLLPGPDVVVFGEMVRSLRALDEIEVTLRELDEQRAYVAGLGELCAEVDRQREAIARYGWLAVHREREDVRGLLAQLDARRAELEARVTSRADSAGAAERRVSAAEGALRAAESADGEGLLAARSRAALRVEELAAEARVARRDAAATAAEATRSRGAAERAAEALACRRRDLLGALDGAIAGVTQVPGDLPASRALAVELSREGDDESLHRATDEAAAEAAAATDEAAGRLAGAQGAVGVARDREQRAEASLAELRGRDEELPRVPGLAAALAAARAADIDAALVAALCEPASGAAASDLAALEALAGDAVLGALVAPGWEAELASVVHSVAPAVRVVVRTAPVALPTWAAALLAPAASPASAVARAALAAALVQPDDLGEIAPPMDGRVELGGARFCTASDRPRLFGAEARRRALRERILEAEAELAGAAASRQGAEDAAAAAARARAAAGALAQAVHEVAAGGFGSLAAAARAGDEQARFAGELAERSAERACERDRAAEQAVAERDALDARIEARGLVALEARLVALRRELEAARAGQREALDALSRARVEAERCAGESQAAVELQAELDRQLVRATGALRARWPAPQAELDDAALAHHVLVTSRGATFRSVQTIRERIAECQRAEAAAGDELERDGARGIKHLRWAARFGFGYDRADNRLTDRRDQPMAGVLAGLEQTIAEQREVASARTRELMERLVMGDLAGDLQRQVENLVRTVREINRLLGGICFGATTYEFRVAPRAERAELVEVVRRVSLLDQDSQGAFRAFIEERVDELRDASADIVPDVLDYRTWFEYRLVMKTTGDEGVELSRSLRQLGSGGEQGVPNYLLVLALARLLFDRAEARLRPLLFDEAFYGIDAGRRDQLLRLASELGLQLVVASPDQDGATPAVRAATTLFVVKDERGDVHLAPYHYWNQPAGQADLFTPTVAATDLADAECRLAAGPVVPALR